MKKTLALFVVAGVAAAAMADVTSEASQFAGHIYIDARTGNQTTHYTGQELGNTVYDNSGAVVGGAFSNASMANVWGDDFVATSGGNVDEFTFAIYNSSSSAGSLLTCTMQILFYDDTTVAAPFSPVGFQGGFNGNVNFGAGLAKGFYSTVTFTGLAGLGINLLDTYNVFTQQMTAKTGTANRFGIVSADPPAIGSSFSDFYQSLGAGGAGWYTSAGINVNLLQKTVVTPAPGAMALLGLGGLVAGRRRR